MQVIPTFCDINNSYKTGYNRPSVFFQCWGDFLAQNFATIALQQVSKSRNLSLSGGRTQSVQRLIVSDHTTRSHFVQRSLPHMGALEGQHDASSAAPGGSLTGSKDGSPHPSKRGFRRPTQSVRKESSHLTRQPVSAFFSVGLKWDPLGSSPRPRTAKQQHR